MANPEHVELIKYRTRLRPQQGDNMDHLDLSHADLSGLALDGLELAEANLKRANLSKASLRGVNLKWADLTEANLKEASLADADLTRAKLRGADLRGANLCGANLSLAVLGEAKLGGSWLIGAVIRPIDFEDADLTEAVLGFTVIADADLRGVKGLAKVFHASHSRLDIDTLYQSRGEIPKAFLRGCGVPETLINYLPSLIGRPLEFFSCFISYTEADDDFSQRLYNDLQGEGVRCWRWRDDAKWGSTLIGEVDQAIRLYDKLIVILSADSLRSEPVIREIERALQKEAREKKEVLFRITIDDAIFSWHHPLATDVLRKVIGDFRTKGDGTAYEGTLRRLVRALRALGASYPEWEAVGP
jgi:hypothetical protein